MGDNKSSKTVLTICTDSFEKKTKLKDKKYCKKSLMEYKTILFFSFYKSRFFIHCYFLPRLVLIGNKKNLMLSKEHYAV